MSDEDYKRGYREGFQDGVRFNQPRVSAIGNPIMPNSYGDGVLSKGCSVCGMKWDGPMGYVCGNAQCPSRVTCNVLTT